MVSEYHPFRRLWKQSRDELVIEAPYFERGPHEYDASDDILELKPGHLKTYEFHWTVSEFINAVMRAGCRIVEVHEFGEQVCEWEGAPMHGLPEYLLIVAEKEERSS